MLDQGYPSVGDWHSTSKVVEGHNVGRGPGLGRRRRSDGFIIKIFCDEGTGEARQMSSKSKTAQL